jgi:hypothetical protein
MRCAECKASTLPRWEIIQTIRVPVCSQCTPRHADIWHFCRCSECADFRVDRMAARFYERGRELDERGFAWRHLSEMTRDHYRERMRAAMSTLER